MSDITHKLPILIPVFNNLEYTQKAVDSLLRNTDPALFECVIIDNGSTDGTPEFLKKLVQARPDNFRVVRLEKNLGFGGGLNRGLEMLSSLPWEFAVIANNDLIFTPGWLDQMLASHEEISKSVPNLGLVGPMSNFAGGTQGMQAQYRTSEDLEAFARKHHELNKGQWHEAGVVVGLLMLFTRRFFDEVGLFDERFFPGTWEENDWELRGALKGFRYAVDRSTFIHHFGSKTIESIEASRDQRKNFVVNRDRFRKKWTAADSPWEDLARQRYVDRGMNPEEHREADGRLRKWVVGACRVKDGARWLERTLSRVSEFADEIVILVDQATTDDTEAICARFPKVVAIEKELPHEYSEAWSRNRVLDMAFERKPDWVYCFDADEVIERRAVERRQELTDPADPATMLWIQPIVQLWNSEATQRVDGLWGTFYQGRMFRAIPGQRIQNANNLIHCGSTPFVPPDRHGFSYLRIVHYGNVDPAVRESKYEWYSRTDTDKDLGMALGAWKEHYWKLYYGHPAPQDVQAFDGKWRVVKNDPQWRRPPFGSFFERDVYRHVKDETGCVLVPFDERPTVSLCMLVKDEAGLLPRAISSVRAFVNEVIVIDTGSVDGSDHVAERMGAKVFRFDWKDDFSAARNFSISKATGDWILRIDPDEVVPWVTATQIPMLVRDPKMEGYVFPIVNWLEEPAGRTDAKWALSETCRLYRNMYPTIYYTNPVHEELDDSFQALSEKRAAALEASGTSKEQAKAQSRVAVAKVPFQMWHYGYLRGRDFLERKFDYYYQLGRKHIADKPEDSRPYFNTAVHLLHTKKYSQAAESYRKTLELDPGNHMAWNDMGVLHMTVTGELGRAEECFKKSLQCMNEHTHPEHRTRVERNLEEVRVRILSRMLEV